MLSFSRSIYSANRDALVTTEPDGLAALRRASHCSSYVALNLPSPLQILCAVPSRHVWSDGSSDLHSPLERLPTFASYCPYNNTYASIMISFARIKKRIPSLSRNIMINKIYEYSVICAIAR